MLTTRKSFATSLKLSGSLDKLCQDIRKFLDMSETFPTGCEKVSDMSQTFQRVSEKFGRVRTTFRKSSRTFQGLPESRQSLVKTFRGPWKLVTKGGGQSWHFPGYPRKLPNRGGSKLTLSGGPGMTESGRRSIRGVVFCVRRAPETI